MEDRLMQLVYLAVAVAVAMGIVTAFIFLWAPPP
jgi:hypothetical protein